MTKNNFSKLKKVAIGDFPDNKLMQSHYKQLGDEKIWKLYEKIANDSREDLNNLATLYKDYGVEVHRPVFDPFVTNKWSKHNFKPAFSLSNRFFAYGDLLFFLTNADDAEIVYFDFMRECLEKMHDQGKYIFVNPLTLETKKMQSYDDQDWPGDQGFVLDGPSFVPVEDKIYYNTKHCNSSRGVEWIKKIITSFYPKTTFVDISDKFINHLDCQLRIYNENLAHSFGHTDFFTKELQKTYKDIKVLDTTIYRHQEIDFKKLIFSQNDKTWKEKEWLSAWIDFDDQNGNIDTGNVSIDGRTVVETYNKLNFYKELENHGIKVERIPLRHSKFWGSGLGCETAVLERET